MKLCNGIKINFCIIIILSSIFLSFGLYNVHSVSDITEGGILGLTLLLQKLLKISPSISGIVLNGICYLIGYKTFGGKFIFYSALSSVVFSVSYRVFEFFPPLWPNLYNMPFLSAILGAVFVGAGVGFCVLLGSAPTGDDALAMSVSKLTGLKIQWVYLVSDLTILLMSLTYIPFWRIIYSLITVVLSGQIIGVIQKIPLNNTKI